MRSERMAKRLSLGGIMRKKLSDITNLQTAKPMSEDEKPLEDCPTDKDYIEQLRRERMTLIRLVAERTKIVELSGAELQKLRISLQKLQQQNLSLAQSNSRMLAELNLGREKVKTLQHELVCKNALLKAKNLEIEGKEEFKRQNSASQTQVSKIKEAEEISLHKADNDGKACNLNKRHATRSRSVGASTTCQKVEDKEKAENKRRRLRRQSARFISQTENLFEIEDVQLPFNHTPDSPMRRSGPTPLISSTRKEGEEDNCAPRRSSVGRPLRKAAEKVKSYKEVPIIAKMRRSE
ncbi:shugoshin-1-like [Pyrus ussuriensis x Pyrus communis]|uniref:Shugoshin-1-like n=1 Tax=Pyrus ussuriensis x Pyrus communis TaxID=2448454 RepID=A0A5N5GIK5_9ROSA|nr:shugoshin-1-like [Pyrus ussuriensis x Pyrus communis]